MTKTQKQLILDMPAREYLMEYAMFSPSRTKAITWLNYAASDIITNSRSESKDDNLHETVLVADLIRYPSDRAQRYHSIGKKTLYVINVALDVKGLSMDMSSEDVESYLNTEHEVQIIPPEPDAREKLAMKIKDVCKEIDNESLCINLGTGIIPGYECSVNFRKIL